MPSSAVTITSVKQMSNRQNISRVADVLYIEMLYMQMTLMLCIYSKVHPCLFDLCYGHQWTLLIEKATYTVYSSRSSYLYHMALSFFKDTIYSWLLDEPLNEDLRIVFWSEQTAYIGMEINLTKGTISDAWTVEYWWSKSWYIMQRTSSLWYLLRQTVWNWMVTLMGNMNKLSILKVFSRRVRICMLVGRSC